MKATLRLAILLLAMGSLTGCGTLAGRFNEPMVTGDYFISTKTDLIFLGVPTEDARNDITGGAFMVCWASIICPLFTLASLPVDLVVDTVMLPFDAIGAKD